MKITFVFFTMNRVLKRTLFCNHKFCEKQLLGHFIELPSSVILINRFYVFSLVAIFKQNDFF